MKHTFNWHDENEGSFLKWVILSLLPNSPGIKNREKHDAYLAEWSALETASDGWKNVELGITLNGIEVDAQKFMQRLNENCEASIRRGVEREIEEVPSLDELNADLYDFQQAVIEKMHTLASKHGLRISDGGY